MKKQYVLDTNVLLHDPLSIFAFEDNNIIIPIYCIEEMDAFKSEQTDRGRSARAMSRQLDNLREAGSLAKGIKLRNGGTLRVAFAEMPLPGSDMSPHRDMDSRILAVALQVQQEKKSLKTALVTMDTNLRIRGDALGIATETYENAQVVLTDDLYKGHQTVDVSGEEVDSFYKLGKLRLKESLKFCPNEFIHLRDAGNPTHTALGKYNTMDHTIVPLVFYKKDPVWGIRNKNMEQAFALELLLDDTIKLVALIGKAGTGKAQPLYSKILTPTGWKLMKDMKPGDMVCTPDGGYANVTGVYPQGKKEIFRVHFTDGTFADCCDDHLWLTKTQLDRDHKRNGSVKSLKEIRTSLRYGKMAKRNHSIPITQPVDFKAKDLPLDPYLLGCLIGDGSLTKHIGFTTEDQEIVKNVQNILKKIGGRLSKKNNIDYTIIAETQTIFGRVPLKINQLDTQGNVITTFDSASEVSAAGYCFTSVLKSQNAERHYKGTLWETVHTGLASSNPVKDALMGLGLFGKKSKDKIIPDMYQTSSIEQRTALVQGLMDTDGTVGKGGDISYTTISPELAKQLTEMLQSLGCTVTVTSRVPSYTYKNEKKKGQLAYTLHICKPNDLQIFTLTRKLARIKQQTKYFPRRYIDKIESISYEDAQCIAIDHPDHLYITDNYTVTHNTLMALAAGLHKVTEDEQYAKLLVSRPVVPMGRDIGYLPGTLEEKLNPWMQPIFDNLEYLMGLGKSEKKAGRSYTELCDMGIVQVEALTYIRGRSIPQQYMIVDEAQNLTPHEVKTIITRAGIDTKIVLTGDPHQIDNPYMDANSNGLVHIVNKFQNEKLFGSIILERGERSELAELASTLL